MEILGSKRNDDNGNDNDDNGNDNDDNGNDNDDNGNDNDDNGVLSVFMRMHNRGSSSIFWCFVATERRNYGPLSVYDCRLTRRPEKEE